jgi:hypothetical protein
MRIVCVNLVGKPETKRRLWGSRHRWEGNIKMDLKEGGYEEADWIHMAQYWVIG